jgi:hypothetical protein
LLSIAPGLNENAGRGVRLGFRDVLRVCIGFVGMGRSGVVSKGEWAGSAADIDTEAMVGNGLPRCSYYDRGFPAPSHCFIDQALFNITIAGMRREWKQGAAIWYERC